MLLGAGMLGSIGKGMALEESSFREYIYVLVIRGGVEKTTLHYLMSSLALTRRLCSAPPN